VWWIFWCRRKCRDECGGFSGVEGYVGDEGGGFALPTQIGLQEAHSTVHSSGQNLGQTCTKL